MKPYVFLAVSCMLLLIGMKAETVEDAVYKVFLFSSLKKKIH